MVYKPGNLFYLHSAIATGEGDNTTIRLDSHLSLSIGLAPCSFLFLNKQLNHFSLAKFRVAAPAKLWGAVNHYQFWRQWNFTTFVLFSLNGAICHKINLPLKSENNNFCGDCITEVVARVEPYISHWLQSEDLCPRDGDTPLFGEKCWGGGRERHSPTALIEQGC